MATLTDMLAAVVLQSSAAVFTHFGVTPEPPKVQAPPVAPAPEQRVVARTPPAAKTARPGRDRADKPAVATLAGVARAGADVGASAVLRS